MNVRTGSLLPFLATGVLMMTASCQILPEPQSDPTRSYVLSASTMTPIGAPDPSAPGVQLRPVELASYLRSRPLIVRRGKNEIEFREFARWGESLELGIERILRHELLALGAASYVRTSTLGDPRATEYRELRVRVLSCEGGADGEVLFRAVWEMEPLGGQSTPTRGDFRAEGLSWEVTNEGSLAASLSTAVARLAAEIGAALER